MTEYVVTDPSGKEFVVTAPEGATQEQALDYAKRQFGSTGGGAAVGNPNVQRQGELAGRQRNSFGTQLGEIGGAAGIGGALGYLSGDILEKLGRSAAMFPQTNRLAPYLENAGRLLQTQRGTAASAGAISGAVGETAGQAVELAGGPQWGAELARFVGGGVGPEMGHVASYAIRNKMGMPALMNYLREATGKEVKLSAQQQAYLDEQLGQLRGGPKSNADLEAIGAGMGDEANRMGRSAAANTARAESQRVAVGSPTPMADRELSDIGGELRGVITKRNEAAINARQAEYAANENAVKDLVSKREAAGQFVNNTPEYNALVDSLKAELAPGKRSESVQTGIKKILSDIESYSNIPGGKRLVQSGLNLDLVQQPSQRGPMTFQALDDVRRKLGEAFRGKPAEGYEAIGEAMAKDLYGKVSEIQKKFAGAPQEKLLHDYAMRTEGLQPFMSKTGRQATALDKFNPDEFATDASTLPSKYFKTSAGIKALRELVGNETQINRSAMEFVNRELKDASGPQVRAWMSKNSEMMRELPTVQRMVNSYAGKLEAAEVSMRNAAEFAKQAADSAEMLVGKHFPAQRAVDLIKSGNAELWAKSAPAIAASPQAKQQTVSAVRQVLADQATSKGTIDLFERSIRPAMENLSITNRAELDFIADKLNKIREMKIPEAEQLGMLKRVLLQATGGWAASAASRSVSSGYQWSKDKMVPE